MRVLAASDLDRTLIYSPKALSLGSDTAPLLCVEMHDGKQASFMTAEAGQALVSLAAVSTIVPVTTRVPEQFHRVTLPGPPPRYAVAANGGVLYVDGSLDRDWSAGVVRALTAAVPLALVWEHAGSICRPEWTVKLRNASGLFCYAVLHRDRLPAGFLAQTTEWAAQRGWRVSLQGRKLYWVPEMLTKMAAVAEVARRIDADIVLAAGDSLLDVELLVGADLGIHPRHGELHETGWSAPTVVQTAAVGVLAGEEIVRWLAETTARISETSQGSAAVPAARDQNQ